MGVEISVIIPTHRRDILIAQCLESLFVQDYPQDRIELMVIDDSGNVPADRLLNKLRVGHSNLRILSQQHKGPAAARNLGIRSSKGRIICFIDDDCVAAKNWVSSMARAHDQHPDIAAIGGTTVTSTDKIPVLAGQFLATGSIETQINGNKETIFFPTCNVSFKRHVLEVSGFDEKFPLPGGEDLELFWRLFKRGHRFVWDKSILVIHHREDTLRSFLKQAFVYGRGNYLVQHLHQDQPLLKELKTGTFQFWIATLLNIFKIPRFSYVLGRKLIKEYNIDSPAKKVAVYGHFLIHKIFYIVGNIAEFLRINKEMAERGRQADAVPNLLILDITHACNLTCRICDIWKTGRDESDMDLDLVKNMLLQAKELGIKEVALSGGEVLLRKDIFDICAYARSIKIKNLGVLSNGMLIVEYLERLKPYLIDNTISMVISLDSLDRGVHNRIRNSDTAWQKTVEALQLLSDLKKENPQVNFNVISIVLNENLEELKDIFDFIKSLGANSLQFQALLPNNLMMAERKDSPFWVEKERLGILDQSLDELIKLKEENAGFIRNSAFNLALMKKYFRGQLTADDVECFSAEKTVLISNQGICSTCFAGYGNIREQSLMEIISGRKRVEAKDAVKKCRWPCLLPCFCD